jgi:hypothetical protein
LDFAGLEKSDIDYVAVAGTRAVAVNMLSTLATFGVKDWINIQSEIRYPHFYEDRSVSISSVFPDYEPEGEIFYDRSKIPLKESWEMTDKERQEVAEYRLQFISEFCGVPRDRIFTVDHHTSHAYIGLETPTVSRVPARRAGPVEGQHLDVATSALTIEPVGIFCR